MMRAALIGAGFAFALAAPAMADGIMCARAVTAADRAVCATPALRRADGDLTNAYLSVRDATRGRLRAELVAQQRRWLGDRDRLCPTAASACLGGLYRRRTDMLNALDARVENGDPELHSLDAPALLGTWTVAGYRVPTAPTRPVPPAALPPFMPATGGTITAAPGRLCSPVGECVDFGLERTTLAALGADDAAYAALGLPATTAAYAATRGHGIGYTLLALPDRTLLASFDLCKPGAHDCVTAFQVWRPASKDARIEDLSAE